jgi:MFS family permease
LGAGVDDAALQAQHAPQRSTQRSRKEVIQMSVAAEMQTGVADSVGLIGRQVVASYTTYGQAQFAVDHLSDSSFPVEHAAIIGRDLSLVEQVTGRMTKTRASVMGAVGGSWFGLFIGLFVGLFAIGPVWLSLALLGIVIGAIWGAIFGFVAHWATRGKRDFASASALVAARYEVTVADAFAERARQLLS